MRTLLAVLLVLAVGVAPARPETDGVAPASSSRTAAKMPPPQETGSLARPTDESTTFPDLNAPQATVTPWKLDAVFELPEIPEPSGLCYCPLTNTMFVVDDGGPERQSGLYEIDLEGNLLNSVKFGRDLEGVCYAASTERLYVCDEAAHQVFILAPRPLQFPQSFVAVESVNEGEQVLGKGGNGFEGIEWCADPLGQGKGYLALLNQDDPTCLLWLKLADWAPGAIPAAPHFMLPQRNSGELYFDAVANEMWVVNSWLNTVAIVDMQCALPVGADLRVKRWEVLPGMAQEGVAFDPQGRLWIGQDVGGVARYVREP